MSATEANAIDVDPGREMIRLMAELYPICRSITGAGVRQTLARIGREIPLEIQEAASGTRVFDWVVPREWNIRDAYIKNSKGERLVDFQRSNLHVVSYSVPVRARLRLAELRPHLHSLPAHPDWVPYRTSYYNEDWGFCLSHRQLSELRDEEYDVCIDSSLADGHLTWGECYIEGRQTDEVLVSCHVCHPSLCNDNLSGIALTTQLARHLARHTPRYTYRFLFIPGTIGSITWLALNDNRTSRIRHGLVVTCVGDGGRFTYKKSRRGDVEIDQAVEHVLRHAGVAYATQDFSPYGYDERQYCSPGFDLPVGCLMRSPHGSFPEYHTSADNFDLVKPQYLAESLARYVEVIDVLEQNRVYLNTRPKCEPQLGRRGLYQPIGGDSEAARKNLAMLWVLNLSDGGSSLLDVARRADMPFGVIRDAAAALARNGLLHPATAAPEEKRTLESNDVA
jgi:aminopeptidase-like protein